MRFGLRPCIGQSQAKVFQDLSDRLPVLNEAYHLESSLTV
jgi:hypothetical protein